MIAEEKKTVTVNVTGRHKGISGLPKLAEEF